MNIKTKNLLLALKNASNNRNSHVLFQNYPKNLYVLECLYQEGFIQSYKHIFNLDKILIVLRYYQNKPTFLNLKLLGSFLTLKTIKYSDLAFLFNKKFVLFLSTNKGYLTGLSCKKQHIGGKALFFC